MHTILGVVAVAAIAYIGTMFDNFFAFAAQLVVTEHRRFKRVAWAQVLGVAALVVVAGGIGSLLAPVPLRVVGLLCVAPWALGLHAWRHRMKPAGEQFRRGALTTFILTLALGGDNLAVWIPLLRASGALHALVTILVFALLEIVFVTSAQAFAGHPRIVTWGADHAPAVVPWVYLLLGVLILVECGTL